MVELGWTWPCGTGTRTPSEGPLVWTPGGLFFVWVLALSLVLSLAEGLVEVFIGDVLQCDAQAVGIVLDCFPLTLGVAGDDGVAVGFQWFEAVEEYAGDGEHDEFTRVYVHLSNLLVEPQPVLAQTDEALLADDEMIHDLDVDRVTGCDEQAGYFHVFG